VTIPARAGRGGQHEEREARGELDGTRRCKPQAGSRDGPCSSGSRSSCWPAAPARAGIVTPSANPAQLANAISAQSGLVAGASFPIGPASPSANGVAGPAGQFFPTDGTQAAVLTNGSVANADPPNNSGSAGTNDGTTARGVNDPTTLRVDVNVPSGTNCIGFDFAFYSEEFPESVGSNFNDAFLAEVDGNDWSFNAAGGTRSRRPTTSPSTRTGGS